MMTFHQMLISWNDWHNNNSSTIIQGHHGDNHNTRQCNIDENKQFANLSFDGVFKINNTNFAFEKLISYLWWNWPYKNKWFFAVKRQAGFLIFSPVLQGTSSW